MKTFAKAAYRVVDLFFQTVVGIFSVLIFSRWSPEMSLEGAGKDCVVLGNGPSLAKDLESAHRWQGKELMAVNDVALSGDFERLRPALYVTLDPYYWAEEISESMRAERELFFQALISKTVWPMTLYAPYECEGSPLWERLAGQKHPYIKVVFFNRTPVAGLRGVRDYLYRRGLGMPWAQNVLVAACFLAVNRGYRTVYVVGADHSWHENVGVSPENVVYLSQHHFYDRAQPEPVYQSDMKTPFKLHELFAAWARMFHGYGVVEEYARSRGTRIYNASSKSYIDAFERMQL